MEKLSQKRIIGQGKLNHFFKRFKMVEHLFSKQFRRRLIKKNLAGPTGNTTRLTDNTCPKILLWDNCSGAILPGTILQVTKWKKFRQEELSQEGLSSIIFFCRFIVVIDHV